MAEARGASVASRKGSRVLLRGCPMFARNGRTWVFSSPMPGKLKRFYGSGDLHFITFSCYRRLALAGCRILCGVGKGCAVAHVSPGSDSPPRFQAGPPPLWATERCFPAPLRIAAPSQRPCSYRGAPAWWQVRALACTALRLRASAVGNPFTTCANGPWGAPEIRSKARAARPLEHARGAPAADAEPRRDR
jgi:hypothetical protein